MQNSNLTSRDLAIIKRVAMNVDSDYQKVVKLNAKIEELTKELNTLQADIDEMEAPVIRKTGGYKSTDIYEKQVSPMVNEFGMVKTDKNGHPMKVTKYVLRYPDTIVPPIEDTNVSEECDPVNPFSTQNEENNEMFN